MTTKPKQDGTMELDVGQIDLLDLPLPPAPEEPRVSKGPPPLPPSLPPIETKVPETMDMPMDMEVPSLALPEPSTKSARNHPVPVSARKLVDGPTEGQRSPVTQLLIGIGGATILCVGGFLVYRSLHKTPAVQPVPAASAAASAAPTHAFTMAPIEFTGPVSSETEPEPSATASSLPTAATAHATGGATHPTATAKPTSSRRSDDVIKVEN